MENSYSFQSPIGFLTICEQDNQLTRLYLDNQDREFRKVETLSIIRTFCMKYIIS